MSQCERYCNRSRSLDRYVTAAPAGSLRACVPGPADAPLRVSPVVVTTRRSQTAPCRPAARISRSTWQRGTNSPSTPALAAQLVHALPRPVQAPTQLGIVVDSLDRGQHQLVGIRRAGAGGAMRPWKTRMCSSPIWIPAPRTSPRAKRSRIEFTAIHSTRVVSLMSAGLPMSSGSFTQEEQVLKVGNAGRRLEPRQRRHAPRPPARLLLDLARPLRLASCALLPGASQSPMPR